MGDSRRAALKGLVSAHRRTVATGGLGAVALLVTAPFGGLERVAPAAAEAFEPGDQVSIGPYDVTFHGARTVSELTGTELEPDQTTGVQPEEDGARLLVLDVTVTNDGNRPETARLLETSVTAGGPETGALVQLADASRLSWVNPGMTYEAALVFEQEPGADATSVTLEIEQLTFIEEGEGVSNLDGDYWLDLDRPAATATFSIEAEQ